MFKDWWHAWVFCSQSITARILYLAPLQPKNLLRSSYQLDFCLFENRGWITKKTFVSSSGTEYKGRRSESLKLEGLKNQTHSFWRKKNGTQCFKKISAHNFLGLFSLGHYSNHFVRISNLYEKRSYKRDHHSPALTITQAGKQLFPAKPNNYSRPNLTVIPGQT